MWTWGAITTLLHLEEGHESGNAKKQIHWRNGFHIKPNWLGDY